MIDSIDQSCSYSYNLFDSVCTADIGFQNRYNLYRSVCSLNSAECNCHVHDDNINVPRILKWSAVGTVKNRLKWIDATRDWIIANDSACAIVYQS